MPCTDDEAMYGVSVGSGTRAVSMAELVLCSPIVGTEPVNASLAQAGRLSAECARSLSIWRSYGWVGSV